MAAPHYKQKLNLSDEDLMEASKVAGSPSVDKLIELLARIDMQIDIIQNLYNMYFAGAEENPPTQQRQHLDRMHQTAYLMKKPTIALRFRFETIHGKYVSYRDRWEKKLRDLEAGRIKRNRADSKKKYYF